MQVCTSLQTDNHASTPPLSFLQAGCPSCRPTDSVNALKAIINDRKKKLTSISIINPARVALHERRHQLESPHSRSRRAPSLSEHCIPVSSADTRRHLRSANRHLLAVPRFRLNTYGHRAFSVAGPIAWNSLPSGIQQAAQTVLGVYSKRTWYLFA